MSSIDSNLKKLGITLPTPAAPLANYVPAVFTGNLLVISGQLCLNAEGKLEDTHRGKLGDSVSLEADRLQRGSARSTYSRKPRLLCREILAVFGVASA